VTPKIIFRPIAYSHVSRIDEKTYDSVTRLMARFDPDEFGLGCPRASVYGVRGAHEHMMSSITLALRRAFVNHGLDCILWNFDIEGQYNEDESRWDVWHVKLVPLQP
jgi:hypothetical protein